MGDAGIPRMTAGFFLDVIVTNLRPDIVLRSHEGKRIIMVGLTVPWEERCEEAYQTNEIKYQDLVDDIPFFVIVFVDSKITLLTLQA